MHTVSVGATGSGKSRLLEQIIYDRLAAGWSVAVASPKRDIVDTTVESARRLNMDPADVAVIDPGHAGTSGSDGYPAGVPGFNPFLQDLPSAQIAAALVAMFERISTAWGARLGNLLTSACIIMAAYCLSLLELCEFLTSEDYREALLSLPPRRLDPIAFAQATKFFRDEFAQWGRTEKSGAVAPALNRVRETVRNPLLLSLLCAEQNTIHLNELWVKQKLLAIHLDEVSLGLSGSMLLAGLISSLLYSSAMGEPGTRPVLLVLDELGVMEQLIGDLIIRLLTVARGQHLHLCMATQHLAGLSPALSAAILGNVGGAAFFRLGPPDARLVASALSARSESSVSRLVLDVEKPDRETGLPPVATVSHAILDPCSQPLRLDPTAWAQLSLSAAFQQDSVEALRELASRSPTAQRMYVHAADTGDVVELAHYVAGVPRPCVGIGGPRLTLTISFPRPRVKSLERTTEADCQRQWIGVLQDLRVQRCVLRVTGQPPEVVRVADVPTFSRTPAFDAYLSAIEHASGQSAETVERTYAARLAAIDRLKRGEIPAGYQKTAYAGDAASTEADDGSL